jgi:S-adenosylmethionine-diacylglycerol 3-amino-3-carboxypropyl transferase
MNTPKNQVELSKLIFTMNWEDPESDKAALQIKPGERVMTITSGGCNTLELLLANPEGIFAVDINPAQSYLMELKINAIQHLSYDEFICLMGLTNSLSRKELFNRLKPNLSQAAQHYWETNKLVITKGILMSGRFEKFVRIASKILQLIQGKRKVQQLLSITNLEEQEKFYDQKFDTWQFRIIFKLLFNKSILAKRGLSADYFYFDDGSSSFAESFYKRARNVLRNVAVENNYFIALYLLGNYKSLTQLPAYLKQENFSLLKKDVHKIQIITADVKEWLQSIPDDFIHCFSLSNICELKSEEDTALLFKEVSRVAANGARCCFRNLIIPREVPQALHYIIRKKQVLSDDLLKKDRSFVYGKVAAYTVHK